MKGMFELLFHCADALDADGLGKEYSQMGPMPELSRLSIINRQDAATMWLIILELKTWPL
jgi:hypothetical protein